MLQKQRRCLAAISRPRRAQLLLCAALLAALALAAPARAATLAVTKTADTNDGALLTDLYNVRCTGRELIRAWVRDRPVLRVQRGHCDRRGTASGQIQLRHRRADFVECLRWIGAGASIVVPPSTTASQG